MDSMERKWLASRGLSGVTVNGTTVPVLERSGRWWYQLIALFRALGFPEAGISGLPTKIGYEYYDSGEFGKYQDTWYGTAVGLSMFVDYLCMYQCSPTACYENKERARTRADLLQQWLSSIAGVPSEPFGPEDGENSLQSEDGSVHDTSMPAETVVEGNSPPDAEQDAEVENAVSASMVPDRPVFHTMMDNLLERTGLLCNAFGIDRTLPRDRQLAQITWLLVFHDLEFVDSPERCTSTDRSASEFGAMSNAMVADASLWRGKPCCSVRALVETAMME